MFIPISLTVASTKEKERKVERGGLVGKRINGRGTRDNNGNEYDLNASCIFMKMS